MKDRKIRVYNSRRAKGQPCIILDGQWLSQANFNVGDYLTVHCQENKLVIEITEKFEPES